ncbi:MAG TPA: phage tail sheath C-terminal domain-containing protein [Burkholderiales bacterium]|nr:phage tail sheath C-terminal domain-containing protein [Burkholderiales bacterium]
MPQVSYPGVYIQEIPSGVRTVTSVSTSIGAFVDFFPKGPMNEAVQIFGMGDFERIYGGLDDRSAASYAISQFFLNGGGEAFVVRVTNATTPAVAAAVTVQDEGANEDILTFSASNEGEWGNTLRVDIDHDTADPTTLFNVTVTLYDGDGTTAKARPLVAEKFLNLSVDSGQTRFVETVINDESALVRVTYNTAATAGVLPAANGTTGGDIAGLAVGDYNGINNTTFQAVFNGATSVPVTLEQWTNGTIDDAWKLRPILERAIRQADTSVAFTGARVDVVEYGTAVRLRVTAGRGGDEYNASGTFTFSTTTAETLNLAGAGGEFPNTQQYALGLGVGNDAAALVAGDEGADGDLPEATDIIGTQAVDPHTGMYALDYVDLFNILCLPNAADLDDTQMRLVVSKALAYCEAKRAFMIVDVPENVNQTQEMKEWLDDHAEFRNNNAAVYFPRPLIPDPKNEYRLRAVGASGTMAGLYARTDGARGVWKTPAGIEATLAGVTDLAIKLTDPQNGTLNPLGINCLRSFPIYGNIAWGGRSTNGADAIASDWKYLAVRRLTLMIEESLFRGSKWVVFEGNDEKLWAKIRQNVGAYMMSLFRDGAFQGTDPKAAFYVKCDKETTTQNDINQGIVNIEVGFAPLKPAEFVVIKIQQIAGQE